MHHKALKPGTVPPGSPLARVFDNMAFLMDQMDAQPEMTGSIAGASHVPGGEVSVATTGGSAANIVPFNPTK